MKPKLIRKKVKSHEEWLEERRKSIGGSDAAAIIGANRYTSPYSVWVEKIGEDTEEKENEAIKLGHDLEDYVAKRFTEETGKKVHRRSEVLRNPNYPFAHANVDRWVTGENAGLECKTTSVLNLKQFKDGMFPENYYFQCLHYMAVTGADKFYLAVLVLGKDFKVFEIERNEDYINSLMEYEKEFWEYVETKTPPPVDGTKATDEALAIHYRDAREDEIALECNSRLEELQSLKEKKKELETEIKLIEQEIKNELGEAECGSTDSFRATWKYQTRKTFDSKRFIKDNPQIDFSKYYKESKSRVLRIKKTKES